MSAQVLSPKSVARIERATGLTGEIRRGWANGGYVLSFVTHDHRHGLFDKKTGQWCWEEDPIHYTSCREWEDQ